MEALTKLCKVQDVQQGAPVSVIAEGFPPLAVYSVDGEIFVTGNVCTHGNALLTEGYQDGDTIECPFHGGAFDVRTGAATRFPCQEPIPTYKAVVQDGWVCIQA